MTVSSLHARACALFGGRLQLVGTHDWDRPTPCAEWDVRALVGHVVAEDLWTPPLLAGRTIAEIGDRFDGDVAARTRSPPSSGQRARRWPRSAHPGR